MNQERKQLIAFGVLCIAAFVLSIIGAAICAALASAGWALVCLTIAALAWWLGSTVADILRNNPE